MPYNLRYRNTSKRSPIEAYRNFVRCGNPHCKVSCDKDRLHCVGCEKWFHFECKGLSRKQFNHISNKNIDYICDGSCFASLLPFSEIEHNDLMLTFNDNNQYPCKKCKNACLGSSLMNCIQCDICQKWFHAECADLEFTFETYVYHNIDFICSKKCSMNILPFSNVSKNVDVDEFNPNRNSFPCKKCRNQCLGFGLENCIQCDVCSEWLHYECCDMSFESLDLLAENNLTFVCSKRCEMSIFPYNTLDLNTLNNLNLSPFQLFFQLLIIYFSP